MRSVQPKGAKRAYQCPSRPEGCSRVSIIGEQTEREVVAQVLAASVSPSTTTHTRSVAGDDRRLAAIADDEAQLEELAQDWAGRAISRAEWLVARNAIQARIDKVHEDLAVTAISLPASVADLYAPWAGLSFDQRRASLRTMVERVEIHPAPVWGRNHFEPERISVVWRS